MTKTITKVRVKKENGTFTDYIPIGAEAKNIKTIDGESVQNKLNNTVYIDDIVDNLDSTDSEKPLSANQGNVLNKKIEDKCEFVFPGKWGLNSAGNSNIVKVQNKVLLFDTNSSSVYSYLVSMLEEEEITHIDYLIVSHFDSDHRGNINNLIDDGYIDENSVYYHPDCLSEQYTQDVITWYNTLEVRCETLGINSIIPTENEIVNISNNTSLRFGNVDTEYSQAHYNKPNSASMVVEFKHNNFCALMMGDALKETEEHLVDIEFIQNEIGLYTIPHHAIEQNCSLPFYELINPKFAVAQSQMVIFNSGELSYNQASSLLFEKGCNNYYSFNNSENIKFIEWDDSISCVKGIPTAHVGQTNNVHYIYCDSVNYNENKQDGSETYPFKDIIQALGMATDYKDKAIVIRLKDGTYGTTYGGTSRPVVNVAQILNRKNFIQIVGQSGNADNCILNAGLRLNNCFNVRIDDITIKSSYEDHVAKIVASNVIFRNCKFIGVNQATLAGYGVFAQNMSNVKTYNCSFQYLNSAYTAISLSEITTSNDIVNNVSFMVRHEDGVKVNIGKINSLTDFQTISALDNYSATRDIICNPQNLSMSVSNKMKGDIDLTISSQNNIYKNLIIQYVGRFNSTTTSRYKKIIPFINTTNLTISEVFATNSGEIQAYTLLCNLSNNVLTISRNTVIEISSSGVLTSHTVSDASNTSYGIQITSIDFV